MAFTKAADLADIPENGAIGVEIDGEEVALIRAGDAVFAIRDECSHAQIKLSEGEVTFDDFASLVDRGETVRNLGAFHELRREAQRHLVGDQQPRRVGEDSRQCEHLLLAVGECVRELGPTLRQDREHRVRPLDRGGALRARDLGPQQHPQVVEH